MEKQLPEVSLKWSDFSRSLEKLRHKTYTKNNTDRDWFRINPLELLLLGCQTLSTGTPTNREYGTMVLVMESIEAPMHLRPRYWRRLLTVLIATCKEDVSPFILQRCVSSFTGVWKSLMKFPEFQPSLYAWCVNEVSLVSFFEWLVESKKDAVGHNLINEVTLLLEDIKGALQESTQLMESGTQEEDALWLSATRTSVTGSAWQHLALELLLMKRYKSSKGMLVSEESVRKLIDTLNTVSSDLATSLSYLLGIIQLLSVRQEDPHTETEEEEDDLAERVCGKVSTPDHLFAAITTALTTWSTLNVTASKDEESPSTSCDISSQILCLAQVILASGPLPVMLTLSTDFFSHTISTLMIYSTEGYLSNSPHKFFHELIEYVSSLVEQGLRPLAVVQTHLPNLFGPVFGTKDHAVSCKLLEYGYLAACSQHQKSLLSEGLTFLVNVYHLFPPLDKARIELAAKLRQLQTREIVTSLLNDIITSVVELTSTEEKSSAHPSSHSGVEATVEHQAEEDLGKMYTSEEFLVAVSDEERESDNNTRLKILFHLLDLACAMVRNGDNVSFLFASTLPKLLSGSFPAFLKDKFHIDQKQSKELFTSVSTVPWQVDKKEFALHLLELATLSLESDNASPFQICGVVAPKLVQNIDTLRLSDSEKMATTVEIMSITSDSVRKGQNITELISHGIDLLTVLIPETTSPQEARKFIAQMTKQLLVFTHSSLLFMLKQSCNFMLHNFPGERAPVQQIFKTLIHRGKRDEVRAIFRLCRGEFESDKYTAVRHHLYSFSTGTLKHRQFVALCEILVAMMDVSKPTPVNRRTPSTEEEEEEERGEERRKEEQIVLVVGKLTQPCLKKLSRSLSTDSFNQQEWLTIREDISKIALFRTLFENEFSTLTNLSETEVFQFFESKFPPDVLSDESLMCILAVCGSRIEHMQVPRYSSLKILLSRILQHFLTLSVPHTASGAAVATSESTSGDDLLKRRISLLDDYLHQYFPRNTRDRSKLIECGYSSRLWDERLCLVVKTDGSHSLEENMRQTLLACYREFGDILQQMAITHVSVDGELVKSSELFDEQLSLTELKGCRAIAVKVIDSKLGRVRDGYYHEKKISLLTKEDKIEEDFAKQGKAPVKPKTFTVALNTQFFDCARCCGAQIIGCYAPNGEHCERPLEIGIRTDSAIASIYDETGLEMENAEVLLTPEGVYLFKAYSNGHPYDTSQVWVSLATALLAEPNNLVPAVIVPQSYPNQRTWETIRRSVQPELTGGILTCEHDFSSEWRTYYDHRPEKVRNGQDIVLHPGFSLSSDSIRPGFKRQKSRMAKDLAGMMFDHVMQDMLQDPWWEHFRFLGKWISQYLSEGVDTGELRRSVIENGLDYDRWKNTFSKIKNPPEVPFPFDDHATTNPLPSKELLVTALVDHIHASLKDWGDTALSDLAQLCVTNHRQFLELKGLVEKSKGSLSFLKEKLPHIRGCLRDCTFTVPLLSLPESLQEEIIHWVFRNEDRVWRYRGGRDRRETLHQFMSFLGRNQHHTATTTAETEEKNDGKVFAGVVTFCVPQALECEDLGTISSDFQVASMIGYAVGEIASGVDEESDDSEQELTRWRPRARDSCYEVVTAWTHPSYRGLNLGVQMYLNIAEQVPARVVMCDMMEGSVERIIHSNTFLRLLDNLQIISFIVQSRQQSYTVLTPDGVTEQFEQVVFSVWPVRIAMKVSRVAGWMTRQRYISLLSIPPLTAVALVVFRRWTLL